MPIDIERARRDTPAADHNPAFQQCGRGADAGAGAAGAAASPAARGRDRRLRGRRDSRRSASKRSTIRSRGCLNADRPEIALVENATRGLGHGVLFHRLRARRPHPHRRSRVRQQLHRLPAGRAAHRRRRRGRAERCSGRARCRGARTHDRSARQADRHHACADQWRPGQSGGGGRAHRPRARHPLSARRLPIRRPDADRRRRDRLRHAVRDRDANICAGRAAPASSMCGAPCSTGSSRRFSICRRRPGSSPTATRCARTRAASRTGNATSRHSSASAPRSTTRSAGV